MSVDFARPYLLFVWLAIPVAALLWWWWCAYQSRAASRRLSRGQVGGPSLIAGLAILLVAGTAVVSAAGPRWGVRSERAPRQASDLVVVLDVSRSMGATDVAPSRLEAAKAALMTTLERLGGGRVGVVVFGGDARIRFPLTSDFSAAAQVISSLEPGPVIVEGGSSVSSGLEVAVSVFEADHQGGRLVLVVTDGDDLGGDPATASALIRDSGIELLVAGVGTEAGSTVPVYDSETQDFVPKMAGNGTPIISRLDSGFLADLAAQAGGRYLGGDLSAIPSVVANRFASLERAELEPRAVEFPRERFQWFAAAALVALGLIGFAQWFRSVLPSPRTGLIGISALAVLMFACATEAYTLNEDGRSAYLAGDLDQAVERFYSAEAARPGDVDIVLNLSGALVAAGRYEEAARAAGRVRAVGDPSERARALDLLGRSRFHSGDLVGALDAFRQELLLQPDNLTARHDYEVVLRVLNPPEPEASDPGNEPAPDSGGTEDPQPGLTPEPGGDEPSPQPNDGEGQPDGQPGGNPGGQDGGGRVSSIEAIEQQLLEIDEEVAQLFEGGPLTAEEAAQILELLAERSRIAALRNAFHGGQDPGDY